MNKAHGALEGHCYCASIVYRLRSPIQRLHRQGEALLRVPDAQFELTKGAGMLRTGPGRWHKCWRCQQHLLYRANGHTGVGEASLAVSVPEEAALHQAAEHGRAERVRQLLRAGYPVDTLLDEQTPLMLAANSAWLDVCRVLLRHGADAKAAVDYAVSSRLPETPALLQLFLDYGCDPQEMLYPVVGWSTPAAARVLLEAGADVNLPDPDDGETALYKATGRSTAMLRLLLKHGAKKDQLNRDGTLPLNFCAVWNLPTRLKALLEFGVNPNQLEGAECPNSALYDACNNGYYHCARILLEHGADPNLGFCEITPLMAASRHGSLAIVILLLTHGAEPERVDQHGKNAISYAQAVLNPDLLHYAIAQAETWQGGSIQHNWRTNSLGETTLTVKRGRSSNRWTNCHAAIVERLTGL